RRGQIQPVAGTGRPAAAAAGHGAPVRRALERAASTGGGGVPGPVAAALAEPGEERRLRPRFRTAAPARTRRTAAADRRCDRRGRPAAGAPALPGRAVRRHGATHRAGALPGPRTARAAARRTLRRAG